MDSWVNLLNHTACITTATFFGAFALTFWPGKQRLTVAAVLYSVGLMTSLGPPVYYRLVHYNSFAFSRFQTLDAVLLILLLCYGIAAIGLLWPSIPQQRAILFGGVLFIMFAATLVFRSLLFKYSALRNLPPFPLAWLVYALLWFRIRGRYADQARLT